VAGDIVELTDGTFAGDGNRDLDFLGKAITVSSASGDPEICILDCGGSATEPHRAFRFHNGETSAAEVSGLTITGGNISADPLLSDPEKGDFRLQHDSPCIPSGDCDLIGAWPVGCGGTPVEKTTWGGLKALFR
jgi:hypothetical protein